jgi:pimeloyl-ACP methyl ester carboxylesterase
MTTPLCNSIDNQSMRPIVRALQVPTHLLSSGGNGGFNPLIDGHLERLLPHVERVVIPDASHEMFLDGHETSAAAMLDFLGRH